MSVLFGKFKEVVSAVAPIAILVVVLGVTVVPVPSLLMVRFILGAVAIIIGLSILLAGVELAFLPLGGHMGRALLMSNKLWFVVVVGFVLGFFVAFAEPGVQVLADQVSSVTGGALPSFLIRILVAAGLGGLIALGLARIVKSFSIRKMLFVILLAALALSIFATPDMLAIAFDSVGAATGAVTVPFILALALGTAAMRRDSKAAEEDSFGLVGISALGAAFGVLILNLFVKTEGIEGIVEVDMFAEGSLLEPFFAKLPTVAMDSLFALLPVLAILLIFQKWKFNLPPRAFRRMVMGLVYAFVGLLLFFVGVNAGFMNVGNIIGYGLAMYDNKAILVVLGFAVGMLIVLTEPAVYVFTHQIEDVTNGHIKRKMVLVFLAVGVAFSVGLSMLRIVMPGLMLWHYLLPGFAVAAALMLVTPTLFVGIGFDSGAVAAGPMTATFVLAFAQGASEGVEGSNVLVDAFGVIAMVTLMPIIALQILGIIYKFKMKNDDVQESGVG
ncbi:MAG: DUF1538 domain-containing protein [Clostridiales bacterium]|nr:DUF1538 domain-containing protein [Clostridiales bacterium]